MYNTIIKGTEPNVIEMLQENIQTNEDRNQFMQKVNDYYKEHKTVMGCPDVPTEMAAGLDTRVREGQSTPYPGQFFADNNKEINRLKAVIDRIQNNPETLFKGWEFNGGEAVVNLANNRLQFYFDEKPSDERIDILKKNFFKWAPTAKAWQRPLTHQTMQMADKIPFVRPKDGRKPTDLQPKPPKRNEPER